MKKMLSIVVPCCNEEDALPVFYAEITKIAKQMSSEVDFEFVFVDDGSTDKTLTEIEEIDATDKRVRFISFSTKFGKDAG